MRHLLRWTITALGIALTAVLVSACGGGDETPVPEEARVTMQEVVNQVETDRPRGSGAVPGVYQGAQVGQALLPGGAKSPAIIRRCAWRPARWRLWNWRGTATPRPPPPS